MSQEAIAKGVDTIEVSQNGTNASAATPPAGSKNFIYIKPINTIIQDTIQKRIIDEGCFLGFMVQV